MAKQAEPTTAKRHNALRMAIGYLVAVIAALAVTLGIIAALGYDVPEAFITLIGTSFRSFFGFGETVKKAIPLIFTTYAFSIPFMIKFFNIGAWGQMLFGGTVTTVVGLLLKSAMLPAVVMIPLLVVVALVSGALYALIAGYLRAYHDVNTIISTIMLNYVAYNFLNFVATANPFSDPTAGIPTTLALGKSAQLGFFGGIPQSIILALLGIVFVYILFGHTRLGYEIKAVGYNVNAAQAYGINFRRTIMLTFIIGGAFAGLGGGLECINIHGKLLQGFATTSGAQYGLFGIVTGLIVAGRPTAIPVAAFFMSVLLVGADALQQMMQIPVELVFVAQALVVLFVVSVFARISEGEGVAA